MRIVLIRREDVTIQTYQFEHDELSIGRLEDNDIVLPAKEVSRHHARIKWSDDGVTVVDDESTAGTIVNGAQIKGRTDVRGHFLVVKICAYTLHFSIDSSKEVPLTVQSYRKKDIQDTIAAGRTIASLNWNASVQTARADPNCTQEWCVVIDDNCLNEKEIDRIFIAIQKLSNDSSLYLKRLDLGSIVLILEGTEHGYENIERLHKEGSLEQLLGCQIKQIIKGTNIEQYQKPASIKKFVFYSYAPEDAEYQRRLEVNLATLKREGLLDDWCSRRIYPGAIRDLQIRQNLAQADLVLLLISPYFFISDDCFINEATQAMAQHAAKKSCIIPILIRPTDFKFAPFAHFQHLPRDGIAISICGNQDAAWHSIAQEVRQAILNLSPTSLSGNRAMGDS